MTNFGALMVTDEQSYVCLESGCWDFSLQRNFLSESVCLSCSLKIRAQQWPWKPATQTRPKVNTSRKWTERKDRTWKEFYIMKFMPGLRFHWLLQTAIGRYPTWVIEELPCIPEETTHIETNKGIKALCSNVEKSHWLAIETLWRTRTCDSWVIYIFWRTVQGKSHLYFTYQCHFVMRESFSLKNKSTNFLHGHNDTSQGWVL